MPTILALLLACATTIHAQPIDYTALWDKATPFDQFLQSVRARDAQWKSRFANAAVTADILNDMRALTGKRRILVVAMDKCSDSAWAVPYVAKLAAAVPERLELRVIGPGEGSRIQSAHLTPDGRIATPTIVVLDELNAPIGAWVERPVELQAWVIKNRATVTSEVLHEHMDAWYAKDAGKATIREIVAVLKKNAAQGGK
ncbi:MAG TPA: thioredoxin family protein [Vicinamibacterales bacterium]|nr:thioredoxin family protein [Vicinamibacterales bacterium]